jgi:hypothetical protein
MIITNKTGDFLKEFKKLITSEPQRKAKPKPATPEEMKSIWITVEE